MNYHFTYRLLHLSTLIREVNGNYHKVRKLVKVLGLRLGDHCRNEDGKNYKSQRLLKTIAKLRFLDTIEQ